MLKKGNNTGVINTQ